MLRVPSRRSLHSNEIPHHRCGVTVLRREAVPAPQRHTYKAPFRSRMRRSDFTAVSHGAARAMLPPTPSASTADSDIWSGYAGLAMAAPHCIVAGKSSGSHAIHPSPCRLPPRSCAAKGCLLCCDQWRLGTPASRGVHCANAAMLRALNATLMRRGRSPDRLRFLLVGHNLA